MKIVIVGAGGFGREVLATIKAINRQNHQFTVLGFVDDNLPVGTRIHDLTVLGSLADLVRINPEGVVVAIGNSRIREAVVAQIDKRVTFPNIIHPQVMRQDSARIAVGNGNIFCAGTIFTTDIAVGNFCIVNLSCTIGHDAQLADFVSVMPSVNISGGAQIARGAYIGTGAKLIKATTLGAYCKVGAGAVVDADVAPESTVVGIPAKPLKK